MNTFISKKHGKGGTYAINIVNLIKENINEGFDNLIIATDGEIDDIPKCDEELKSMKQPFSFVKTYIIGKEANLSVGVPFSRNCPYQTILVDENGENMKLSKTELDNQSYNKIDTISEYSEFEDIYQSLYKCIFARVIGKKNGDENVIVKLNGLKNRILQNIDEQNKEKFNLKFDELYKMANGTTIIGTEISAADNELLK